MSETLLNEIRATRPAAPAALRERVRTIVAEKPAREPFLDRLRFNWGWRRLVLVAPATVVVALVAAGVIGLTRDDVGGGSQQAASGTADATVTNEALKGAPPVTRSVAPSAATADEAQEAAPPWQAAGGARLAPGGDAGSTRSAIAPTPGQLQRYQAELRLRVDDVEALSGATKRAQQIAVAHGGSVASLQYDAPAEGVGAAQITLRIPTARVQSALTQLAALGTILGQRYGIEDLQQQADSLQTQIEQTQRRIAAILTQLESATLSAENRVVLQSRLSASRQKLTGLRESLRGTNADARTATVYLTLTTEEIQPGAVGGGSRLDDIKDVLAWEGVALLYFLVVAGPFILLGLLIWLALRLARRRQETRLLAQN
jgi:hypothetical protein